MSNARNIANDAPVLFTGMPRSGTSMLGRVAQEYLGVAAVNEGVFELWLARQAAREKEWEDSRKLDRVLREFVGRNYFIGLFRGRPPKEQLIGKLKQLADPPTIQTIGHAALQIARDQMQLPRLGHEGPPLMEDPRAVMRVFPNARFVHVVRDPRDGALSVLQKEWGANNVYVYADKWRRLVQLMRDVGRELGPERYFEYRYEDILQSPEQTMSGLMTFVLGEVAQHSLAEFVRYMRANPRRANFGKWKTDLSSVQAALVEAVAWDQMRLSGYELPDQRPTCGVEDMVYWRSHHRCIQLLRILRGKLRLNGSAKLKRKYE